MTLVYDVGLPAQISVSKRFDNSAGIRTVHARTNTGGVEPYYPADNIDATVPSDDWDIPAADDDSYVAAQNAVVTKGVVTDIGESGNNIPSGVPPLPTPQATIGETMTYTVGVAVPAHTTVFNAVLTDPLPTGITRTGSTAGFSATGSAPVGALPGGFSFDPSTGTLTFPTTYQNSTATPHLFQVTITALVSTLAANTHGTNRDNTARFNSRLSPGGTPVPERTATARVTVVEPNPALTKTANATEVIGGQVVTYTLRASNGASRPPLHDSSVIDCLPAGLTFTAFFSIPVGTTASQAASTGSDGCDPGETRIQWDTASILGGVANAKSLIYRATVDPSAAGGATYRNDAALTGGTLSDGSVTPNPAERTYTRTNYAQVTVTGQEITKGVTPDHAPVGEIVEYQITSRVPANTTFYEAAIVDTLPAGLAAAGPGFSTVGVTCTEMVSNMTCPSLSPSFGTPLTSSGQTVGWYLGDLPANTTNDRLITVTYRTVVLDMVGNTAGTTRNNAATVRWSTDSAATPPSTVGDAQTLPQSEGPAEATLTVTEPSLSIDKSVSNATPAPGQSFTYTVRVTNASGVNVAQAHAIDLTDDVPAGVIVNAGSISNGGGLAGSSPTTGNGTITWNDLGPLAPGDSVDLTYTANLAAAGNLTGAALTNTADITEYWSNDPSDPESRTYDGPQDTASVTPRFPNFSVAKTTPDGDRASIGSSFRWRLDVTNSGGADGFDVDVTDILPPNWTYDIGSARVTDPQPGGTPTAAEPVVSASGAVQTLTWTDLGDLPASGVIRIELTATPGPSVTTSPGVGLSIAHTNTASAEGEDAGGATGNAGGTYSAGPDTANAYIASADLGIDKSPATSGVAAGGTASWTLTVTNHGPDPSAAPFTVTDTLPSGLTGGAASGSGWTCTSAGPTFTCTTSTPASLASGSSLAPITVSATAPTGVAAGMQYTNSATVTGTTHDPNPTNDSDTAVVTMDPSADLTIDKATIGDVIAGANVTYRMTVTNNGPSTSLADVTTPIAVTDTLPSGLTFVSATGAGWTCGAVGQVVLCTNPNPIAVGASAPTIDLVANVALGASSITNTAAVAPGLTPDPVPGNNSDSVADPVGQSADLSITKSHGGAPQLGDVVTFTLAVSNLGPSIATGVEVADSLPAGLTPNTATGTGWTCSVAGQDVECSLGTPLSPGAATPITVTATIGPDAVPSASNTAAVESATPDPVPANNTSTDIVAVDPLVDLSITKTHTGDFVIGERGTFTLQVTNAGPTRDPGPITVTDTLPDGLAHRPASAASGSAWSCTAAGQVVTCTLADGLDVGETSRFELAVDVTPGTAARVTNTATVTSPSTDTDPVNNTDSDDVAVGSRAALSLTKAGTVSAGGAAVTWLITVSNKGPSPTTGRLVVTDTLPSTLTYRSSTGEGWVCTSTGQVVTCTTDAVVAAGADAAPLSLVTSVDAREGTSISNTASATGGAGTASATGLGEVSAGADSGGRPTATPDERLAFTGMRAARLVLLALSLLVLGVAAVVADRRYLRR